MRSALTVVLVGLRILRSGRRGAAKELDGPGGLFLGEDNPPDFEPSPPGRIDCILFSDAFEEMELQTQSG
jgi:hypothetical protein